MPIQRLNHAVLYVRDVERSVRFYADVLGFRPIVQFPGAAFLRAADSTNDHDLGLFQIGEGAEDSAAGRRSVGLYHLAWEVDTLGELQRVAGVLRQAGALVGASDHHSTKSLYAKDPDGLEFEVCWLLPADALPDPSQVDASQVDPRPLPLDLDAEIARFGADTLGGIGVSVPATTA
ncbi:MAG: VOC family protein [Acidimicrobiales bacterium]